AVAAVADRHKVRQRVVRVADFLGHDGAQARVHQTADAFLVTGVQVVLGPAVSAFAGAHAADDGAVLHQLGQAREVFADLDAGHAGVDGPIGAALRGVRLQ